MEIGTIVLGAIIAGVLLFLWGGLTQAITPWGIRSVKGVPAEKLANLPDLMEKITPPSGMYGVFNAQVAAFVAVKPGNYYNMGRYFAIEFVTQAIAGILLAVILALTVSLDAPNRILLVGLIGLLGEVSIDLQYWNWWGFSTSYSLGFAVNRIVGYLVIAFILVNFVLV